MRLGLVYGVAWVFMATITACATERPAELKPIELTDFKPSLDTRIVWRVGVGSSRNETLQPAVLDNAVYVAAASGALMRIAPESGSVVWRIDVGARISAGVGSDGLLVVVATPRGDVLAFGPDGKPLWTARVSSDVTTPPLVGRGLVVVRSTDHRVTAFDAAGGKRKWTFQRQQPPLTLRTVSDMRFADDSIVGGFPGGRLIGIALSNGASRWETTVAEPKGATEVERLADVVGPVVVGAGDVCAAAYQGRLMCVDASNGNLRWARDMPASAGVALDSQTVYSVDSKSHVQAFARAGGASVWVNDKLRSRELTAPAVLPQAVAVGDLKGYLHFLSPADGAFLARVRIDSSRIVATPQAGAGLLVVQTQGGDVAAIALEKSAVAR